MVAALALLVTGVKEATRWFSKRKRQRVGDQTLSSAVVCRVRFPHGNKHRQRMSWSSAGDLRQSGLRKGNALEL